MGLAALVAGGAIAAESGKGKPAPKPAAVTPQAPPAAPPPPPSPEPPPPAAPEKGGKKRGPSISLPPISLPSIPQLGKVKLPEEPLIARLDREPNFPKRDPNYKPSDKSLALFGALGPMEATWGRTTIELQRVMDEIVAKGPRPKVKAQVRISVSDFIDARAFDNGTIVVTTGLLKYVTERATAQGQTNAANDLTKFILAHEYAHILLAHPQLQDKSDNNYKRIGDAIRMAGSIYYIGRGLTADPNISRAAKDRQALQSLGVMLGASLIGDILQCEVARSHMPGYVKGNERDADLLAVDIMYRLGEDPVLGAEGLSVIPDQNKEILEHRNSMAKRAQKLLADTVKQLALAAPTLMLAKRSTDVKRELSWVLVAVGANFIEKLLDDRRQMADILLHDDVGNRIKVIKAYALKFAPKTPAPAPAASSDVDFAKIAAEMSLAEAADSARQALANGDIPLARKEIDKALNVKALPPHLRGMAESADIQETAAAVAAAELNYDRAIAHYRVVLKHYAGVEIYMNIARMQRMKGDTPGALKTLAEGMAKTGQPARFILARIDIHREAEDQAALDKDVAECRAVGDKGLLAQCMQRAKPPEVEQPEGGAGESGANDTKTIFLRALGIEPPPPPPPPPPPAAAPEPAKTAPAAKPKPAVKKKK